MSTEDRIRKIKECVRSYPDFPKPGVVFRDVFALTEEPTLFHDCISLLVEHIIATHPDVDVIVGLDSRGFIFGPLIAQRLMKPFVPIRKSGKLPGEIIRVSYSLEYGQDVVEMQASAVKPGQKVVVVDDLLATGGTMKAACDLLGKVNANIVECLLVFELEALRGRDRIPHSTFSLISF